AEIGRPDRQRDRLTGEGAARVNRRLERAQLARNQIAERLPGIRAQCLDRVLERAERAVVLHVDVSAAVAELVVAEGGTEVLVELTEILRPAERDRRARIERQVAGQRH